MFKLPLQLSELLLAESSKARYVANTPLIVKLGTEIETMLREKYKDDPIDQRDVATALYFIAIFYTETTLTALLDSISVDDDPELKRMKENALKELAILNLDS